MARRRDSSGVHDIVVRPVNNAGCHYTDRIDIDTGIFRPFVAGYARWFYKMRQRRWRELAKELAKEAPESDSLMTGLETQVFGAQGDDTALTTAGRVARARLVIPIHLSPSGRWGKNKK